MKKPTEIILLRMPSKEKMSTEELKDKIEFIFVTKEEKVISHWKISFPMKQILEDIFDVKAIKSLQKLKE